MAFSCVRLATLSASVLAIFSIASPMFAADPASTSTSPTSISSTSSFPAAAELVAAASKEPSLTPQAASAGHDGKRFFIDDGSGNRLTFSGVIQFRYQATIRNAPAPIPSDPDLADQDPKDFTHGFSNRRVRLGAQGTIQKDTTYRIEIDFAGGPANLIDSAITHNLGKGLSIRAGQFKLPFLREEIISHTVQLATDRSLVNTVFTLDISPAISLDWKNDTYRASFSFNDGGGVNNTYYDNPREADWALTGRIERAITGPWSQSEQFTSWIGDPFSLYLGAAGHAQQGGDTGSITGATNDVDFYGFTGDVMLKGNGWNAFAAVVGRTSQISSGDVSDYGLLLQIGAFVAEQHELFARYALIVPDTDRSTDDAFHEVIFGHNYYISPKSHVAKLTTEVVWFPGDQAGSASLIKENANRGFLNSDEPNEVTLRIQLQAVF